MLSLPMPISRILLRSFVLFIPMAIAVTGCTGSNLDQASDSGASAQRLPADIGTRENGESVDINPSDDPNLILPETNSRAKTESTGSTSGKSRKPASAPDHR